MSFLGELELCIYIYITQFSGDTNVLDDKIDSVEKKTDISGLASLNDYLKNFNI